MNNYQSGNGNHHGNEKCRTGKGNTGFCSCKNCGYTINHETGIPCKTMICPICKIPMARTNIPYIEFYFAHKNDVEHNPIKQGEKTEYPKVISEKCKACGLCIDSCPMATIVMIEGKAFIEVVNCSNCRICIRVCPDNAIILHEY